jgi:hypothetical protein
MKKKFFFILVCSGILIGVSSTVRSETTVHWGTCQEETELCGAKCPNCGKVVEAYGHKGPAKLTLCPDCGYSAE